MQHEIAQWVEGLVVLYVVAAIAVGILLAWAIDAPWWIKLIGVGLWPITAAAILWSMRPTGSNG